MKSLNPILIRLLIVCFLAQNVLIAQAATNQHANMANCDDSQMIAMSLHDNHNFQINNITSNNKQENKDINSCHDEGCSGLCQYACHITTLLPIQLVMFQDSPDILNSSRPKELTVGHAFHLLRPPAIL